MNILFIAQRVPYPANKGEKIRSFNQIKYLAGLGHEINVLAPLESSDEIPYCKKLSSYRNISCDYTLLPQKWIRLLSGLFQGAPLSVANFYVKAMQCKLEELLNAKKFDVIVCTSSGVAKYIFDNQKLPSLPHQPRLLMDFMDLDSDKWQQYADNSSLPISKIYQREARLLAEYEKKIQQLFDACFFIADAEVNLFKKKLSSANNVFTLGNGMSTEEFYPAQKSPENPDPVFLFTGVMDYKPNIDAVEWFVKTIWQNILAQYPKARFIIAGMNPTTGIEELTKFSGIEVTGFVDEILPYYHQADYFVAPFRLARGVQNKVLQAFACGLPVISTPMGAEGIDCEVNKDILLAQTTDDFIQAINLLETDVELKKSIKRNALSLIQEQYSWEGKLQVLADVINS